MADLSLKLSHDGGGNGTTAFMLQATNINFSHDRAPIMVPLAGTNPLFIDLGQWKVSIQIEGTVSFPGTNLSDGGIAIADKDDLEKIVGNHDSIFNDEVAVITGVKKWYNETITLTDTTNSIVSTYEVKSAGLKLSRRAAQEFYTFTLSLVGKLN
jgi:hypothetical protein